MRPVGDRPLLREPRPDAPVIVVAEDHADSREALRILLEASGYRVREALNGEEAVAAVREERPALVLMDMMMPVLDGFEATRRIREEPANRDLTIIAVTAMDSAEASCLHAGCDLVVRKPIDVRRFLAIVRDRVAIN
jgi:two-component system, cell cycle response regulator DivK